MKTNLTEIQKIKLSILEKVNFDIKKAKEIYNFIISTNESFPNGVYYVLNDGNLIYLNEMSYFKNKIIGVAVKLGEKIATIALHDVSEKEIPLATNAPCGTKNFYHSDFFEAITDWNGEANTKDYGEFLNPDLKEGEYIPSFAQLYLIFSNIKEVNKALEAVGGTPMKKRWYWSSTEHSSEYSWYIELNNGNYGYGKKYSRCFIRPVVAFKYSK